jgi:hypothetical protein
VVLQLPAETRLSTLPPLQRKIPADAEGGCRAFSLLSTTLRIKLNAVRLNPTYSLQPPPCFLTPKPPKGGLNPVLIRFVLSFFLFSFSLKYFSFTFVS